MRPLLTLYLLGLAHLAHSQVYYRPETRLNFYQAMRHSLTIVLIILSITTHAQIINLFSNGTMRQHEVRGLTKTSLITEKGAVHNDNIDSLQVIKSGPYADELRERYNVVSWSMDIPGIKPPIVIDQQGESIEIDFAAFEKQRNAGKFVQLLGIVVLGYVTFVDIANGERVKDGKLDQVKGVPRVLPLLGFGTMGAGILIDMDASKNLYKRRR